MTILYEKVYLVGMRVENSDRIILHIDMDAFFASIEERDNPRLQGLPVVVGSDPQNGRGRGVVSTANYEARKLGIRSALPITRAWRYAQEAVEKGIVPRVVFLPVYGKRYGNVSRSIMNILSSFALPLESCSIDEAYIDATSCRSFARAIRLAKKIKEAILTQERLTCSIGIAPNKLVAKIASDLHKPNGLTIVKPEEVLTVLAALPLRSLPGIGPKTEILLNAHAIFSLKDLGAIPCASLEAWLGKWGKALYYKARGIDDSPLQIAWEAKSIGHQETLPYDTLKTSLLLKELREMTMKTVQELQRKKLSCRTVQVVVRFADFETKSHAKTLPALTDTYEQIWELALSLFLPFLQDRLNPRGKLIRLLGVSLSNVEKQVEISGKI